jgi:hypothetical protein
LRVRATRRPAAAWPGIVVAALGAALLAALAVIEMFNSFLLLTTTLPAAAAGTAVVLWAVHARRAPGGTTPDAAGPAPRLARTTPALTGTVAVFAAALVLLGWWLDGQWHVVELVAGLMLATAAVMRLYRFARPGAPSLDRLSAAMALVPGAGSIVGAAALLVVVGVGIISTWITAYLAAGALALVGGALWLRRPPG